VGIAIKLPYGECIAAQLVFEDLRVDVARPIGLVVWNLDLCTVGTFSSLRRQLLQASITLDLLAEM